MAQYFNAKGILPDGLIAEVLKHIPEECRSGAVIYFSEDYYARRNAEINRCFQIYQSDPQFGSLFEMYEALSEQYGLTVRQIWNVVSEAGSQRPAALEPRRRYSGVRVGRASRRMTVRSGIR